MPILIKKKFQMKNLNFHPKNLGKEHSKPKTRIRLEIIKIRWETNEVDDENTIGKNQWI